MPWLDCRQQALAVGRSTGVHFTGPALEGAACGSAAVSGGAACQASIGSKSDSFPQRISDVPRSSAVRIHDFPILNRSTTSIACMTGARRRCRPWEA